MTGPPAETRPRKWRTDERTCIYCGKHVALECWADDGTHLARTRVEHAVHRCGAAYSLGPHIVVWCDRGSHQNLEYHEGPLEAGSPWRVRWNPIGADENGVRLVQAGA